MYEQTGLSWPQEDVSVCIIEDLEIPLTGTDMHDGGTSIVILLNDKAVCESRAIYGTKMQATDGGKDWTTISQMTDCEREFDVKKGDKIKLLVNYDEIAHPV
jgi:hypothetical protein